MNLLQTITAFNPNEIFFLNNSLLTYAIATTIIILGFLFSFSIQKILNTLFTKKQKNKDSIISKWLDNSIKIYTKPIFIYFSIVISLETLIIGDPLKRILDIIIYAYGVFLAAQLLSSLISLFIRKGIKSGGTNLVKPLRFLNGVIKFVIWTIALLIFLDNIGFQITTLAASLGIGGIAVAFAAQALFQDLFSYITISFDQPFDVGDYIVVGNQSGYIERIGIKTTRMRSLIGELIIIPNQILTSERIHNYKTLNERRVNLDIGLTYQTSSKQLAEIPTIIEEIISNVEGVTFSRCHFNKFNPSSLNFEVIYYIQNADYMIFMDKQQIINLKIKEIFDEKGLDFAYPTQTLFIEKNDSH